MWFDSKQLLLLRRSKTSSYLNRMKNSCCKYMFLDDNNRTEMMHSSTNSFSSSGMTAEISIESDEDNDNKSLSEEEQDTYDSTAELSIESDENIDQSPEKTPKETSLSHIMIMNSFKNLCFTINEDILTRENLIRHETMTRRSSCSIDNRLLLPTIYEYERMYHDVEEEESKQEVYKLPKQQPLWLQSNNTLKYFDRLSI